MERVVVVLVFVSQVQPGVTSCQSGWDCVGQQDCVPFQDAKASWKKMSAGTEKDQRFKEILELICNKKERKVCCEPDSCVADSTKLPRKARFECGIHADLAPGFVVGGNDTLLGEYPWTVLMGKENRAGTKTAWHCGGTLLNEWWVLTAAHCVPLIKVRVGEWLFQEAETRDCTPREGERVCKDEGYDCLCGNDYHELPRLKDKRSCGRGARQMCAPEHQDIYADKVLRHPEYRTLPNSGLVVNDIALVKLKRCVKTSKFVTPICLPAKDELDKFGEPGRENLVSHGKPVVVGWGKTYNDTDREKFGITQAKQQKVELPVVSNEKCIQLYSQLYNLNLRGELTVNEHLCAGGEIGKDSCSGDSGGPLVGRVSRSNPWELVGVVSAGTEHCGRGAPGLFTRVTGYLDWIRETIQKE